ncbi:MAG: DUF4124 domain-containing protein [Candidatus Thiodiazotropha sp.]
MLKLRETLSIALILIPLVVSAGEVYRTVDDEGNVTYTDAPPGGGVETQRVEIHEGPSQESLRHTQERNQAIRKAMEEARDKRLEKEATRQEKLDVAQQAVDQAEKNLERVQEMGEDDRETVVGGRSRIRPEYFERVKKAEDELKAARERLKDVRGY